jgi:predicted MFS family arabinose efflux permease
MSIQSKLPVAFRRLAWCNLAAQSAEQIALAATPILAVLMLGADAGGTGLLQTAATLPYPLFAIAAGVLADRTSRGMLMAVAEALRAVALITILVLAVQGLLTLPLLAVLSFIGACGTIAFSVAGPALVPSLVARNELMIANGRIELARTVAFAAGPALGGALVGWTGGPAAFSVAAVLSLCAVILLAGLREPPRPAAPPRNIMRDLREGIGFVFRHYLLRPVFIAQFIFNTAFFMLLAVYAPYAIHQLGLSASGVGLTLSAYGVGMVTGALLAPRLTMWLPFGIVIAIGPVAGLAAGLVMMATIWAPYAILASWSFFLMGAGPIVWVISTTTLRQTVTPEALLGRVSAINIMAYGARPLGAALGALVGVTLGTEICLVLAAIGFLIQALVILLSPVPRLANQPPALAPNTCTA